MLLDYDLEKLLNSEEIFPLGSGIKFIAGKTLTKTQKWWKAILLVDTGNKKQVRLYAWYKNKEGDYKVRQKFNISKGYSTKIAHVLLAFGLL